MDWETTMLSYGVKPWDVDECIALTSALDQMNNRYSYDYDFEKDEFPKLRAKPLDDNNSFDQILSQRRNAFINHRFDIIDIGIVKLKFSDLINTSKEEQKTNDVSIFDSKQTKKTVEKYQKQLQPNVQSDNNQDYISDNNPMNCFDSIDGNRYPVLGFCAEYPLKCKWIDNNNNIHFEYFKLYEVESIINKVINLDRMNHPLCDNWCVQYKYEYNDDIDNFEVKSKSFDYDLFWSCCLYFYLFKTCGIIHYDNYFKQIINKKDNIVNGNNNNNSNNKDQQIFYSNKKEDVFPKKGAKEHVCDRWCEQEKYYDRQAWFATHGQKQETSKPADRSDQFYVDMINRKKCFVLGNFKVIDRQKKERTNQENDDGLNIFKNDKIIDITNKFKQNNEFISYRLQSHGSYRHVRSNNSDFDFADYDPAHRCIAVWKDDNGKIHEEWFKLYPYDSLFDPASNGNISSIYWHVCFQLSGKYYGHNTFWTLATMFKVFGICGIKDIDEQFYYLRRIHKYLVHGYVNKAVKTNNLCSKIPIAISELILKYFPFISGELS